MYGTLMCVGLDIADNRRISILICVGLGISTLICVGLGITGKRCVSTLTCVGLGFAHNTGMVP